MPEVKFSTPRSTLVDELKRRVEDSRQQIEDWEKLLAWEHQKYRELKRMLQWMESGE